MTSRRSPPRRSSGNSAALVVAALAWSALASAQSGPPDLVETHDGVTIDWRAGTLSASGGAAADLRMPSVDLSRPGAERRAHAAALAKLRSALVALPLGGGRTLDAAGIDRALGHARTVDTQYQSNGGAVVRLEVRFADWIERSDPIAVTLTAAAMPLAAAPAARVGGREIDLGAATFRLGAAPPGSHAVAARADRAGNLAIEGGGELAAKLAGAVALIYVQRVQK